MLAFYVDFPLTREKIFTVKINLLSARGERRCLSSSCWYFRDNGVHCIGGNGNCWLLYRIDFVNWFLSVGMVDGCHLSHCASSYRYLSSSPFLPIHSCHSVQVDRRCSGLLVSRSLVSYFIVCGARSSYHSSFLWWVVFKKIEIPLKSVCHHQSSNFWWYLGWIHEDLFHASTCM